MKFLSHFRFGLLSLLRFALLAGAVLAVWMKGPWVRIWKYEVPNDPLVNWTLPDDMGQLIAIHASGRLSMIEVESLSIHRTCQLPEVPRNGISLSPNGLRLASYNVNHALLCGELKVWNLENGKQVGTTWRHPVSEVVLKTTCKDDGLVLVEYGPHATPTSKSCDWTLYELNPIKDTFVVAQPPRTWSVPINDSDDAIYDWKPRAQPPGEHIVVNLSDGSFLTNGEPGHLSRWRRRYDDTWQGHLGRPEVWLAIVTGLGWLWGLLPKRRAHAAPDAPKAA